MNNIENEAKIIIDELVEKANLKAGQILVIGCSTSEVVGGHIGKNSNKEIAESIYKVISKKLEEKNIYLSAQCCEHLNRALVIEREAMEKYGFEEVNVVPAVHAGGSFATVAYENMKEPVVVEEIKADAGLDIGETLIGMHLKRVAVPLRLSVNKLGEANIICAYTRAKYIGGSRAKYL
jgi:uncharacterized protein (TIGR01440 family)